jgi:hypothetical protein
MLTDKRAIMSARSAHLLVALLVIVQIWAGPLRGQMVCIPLAACDEHEVSLTTEHPSDCGHGHGPAPREHDHEECGCHAHLPIPSDHKQQPRDAEQGRPLPPAPMVVILRAIKAECDAKPMAAAWPEPERCAQVIALRATRLLI